VCKLGGQGKPGWEYNLSIDPAVCKHTYPYLNLNIMKRPVVIHGSFNILNILGTCASCSDAATVWRC
jgi:hypothetical protein